MLEPTLPTEQLPPGSTFSDAARLSAVLEAAVDAIISIDARGAVQMMNPAAERLFGYAATEVVGRNVKLLMPPPFRDEHDEYIARYLRTGERRIIGIGREAVGLRKDGSTFPMDLAVAEAKLGSESIFVGIIRDITERKRAEATRAQLAAIVESSGEAIIAADLRGCVVTWNAGAEHIFGFAAAEAVGRPLIDFLPAERADDARAILERVIRGERIASQELVCVKKGGDRIDVSLTASPIKDSAGSISGTAVIARDVTDAKRINEEIRSMTQQLWHSAKLATVGELAASIAHELNNPLATVTLRVESVLNRTAADDPRRKWLEVIAQEVQRMAELVSNLLQFSRRGVDQISTLDVRDELNRAVDLIHHHLRKHQVTVSKEFGASTPNVYADRQKLRQVFLNLLTNASDAMPDGGRLVLRTDSTELQGGAPGLLVEIADTGVGIPPEHLDRVLEPFYTTKEEGKGTGLGLAICRRIVQELQGFLGIESTLGRGTTIRITVPVWSSGNVDQLREGKLAGKAEEV